MVGKWGVVVLLLGATYVFPNELIGDLYQRNNLVHINLLRNSIFFDQNSNASELSVLENYHIGNYSAFIKSYESTYKDKINADNQLMFYYLISKYKIKEYSSLKNIYPSINAEMLSIDNWRDLQKVKAISYYLDGNEASLSKLVLDVKADSRSNQELMDVLADVYKLELASNGLNATANVNVDYYDAWTNLKEGKYGIAKGYFDKAKMDITESDLRCEFIEYGLGVALYASGNYQEAVEKFQKKYTSAELAQSVAFFKILAAFDNKNYSEVVTLSAEFLADKPSNYVSQTNYLRGVSLYSLGDKEKAKKVLEEVKDFSAFVKYILAEIYYDEGSYAKAKTYYQGAKSSNDVLNSYVNYGLGWATFKLAQYKEAESIFDKNQANENLSENIKLDMMLKSADSSYNSGSYKDAAKKYIELLNVLSKNKEGNRSLYNQNIYNLVTVYMKLKDFKKANEILEKYFPEVKNDREKVLIRTLIGNNNYQLKDYKLAAKVFEEILVVYSAYKDEDIYISLANSYFNDKEYGRALVVYQDYFKEYPKGEKDMDAKYGMVQTYYHLNQLESALALAKDVDETYGIGLVKEIEGKIKFKKETVIE